MSQGQEMGYAVYAEGMGFQGIIGVMAGFAGDMTVTGLSIVESVETPGLGDRVKEDSFLSQFWGCSSQTIGDGFSAVTGATVSSEAVLDILRRAFKDAEDIL
ncbi:MAG: FMN-binding protein [Elusimicrobia bacterium]|nr:FMN-binding protein [Elusimicrobiota bacterium]